LVQCLGAKRWILYDVRGKGQLCMGGGTQRWSCRLNEKNVEGKKLSGHRMRQKGCISAVSSLGLGQPKTRKKVPRFARRPRGRRATKK